MEEKDRKDFDEAVKRVSEMFKKERKMRDPERITRILEFLRVIWSRNPDLRLGQLLLNCAYPNTDDIYYLEDDELLKRLEETYFKFPS